MVSKSLAFESLENRQLLATFSFPAVQLTAHDQLLLELINRARLDPAGEAARFGVALNEGLPAGTISAAPKQALAPQQALARAAAGHSQDMLNRDYFSHNSPSPNSTTPLDRITAAGYSPVRRWGENLSWHGFRNQSVDKIGEVHGRHRSLFLSAGHRQNLLDPGFREAGTGVRYGDFQGYNAAMVTEVFGSRGGDHFVSGVVFSDNVINNRFYSVGEGISNITVTALNIVTGDRHRTKTGGSGGYSLQLPDGEYKVTATGLGLPSPMVAGGVTVSGGNQKVDFDTENAPPVADPGGPYTAPEGGTIVLNATGSQGKNLTFEWDLDNDGVYGEANTARGNERMARPTFSAAGLDGATGVWHPVSLRVRNGAGQRSAPADVQIAIANVGPTMNVQGPSQAVPFQSQTYTFSADDPSPADRAEDFTYVIDWGDGHLETVVAAATGFILEHTYVQKGARSVQAAATDRDNSTGATQTESVDVVESYLHNNTLYVGGTAGDDLLHFYKVAPGNFAYRLNGAFTRSLFFDGQFTAYTGDGVDRVSMDLLIDQPAVFFGGAGNDRLYSGIGDDRLHGGPGRDYIEGRYGDDSIWGGEGNDVIRGHHGDDRLWGGEGQDRLDGDRGNDLIRGEQGRDLLRGGQGDDVLAGGTGNDRLFGQVGANLVIGGDGRDTAHGGIDKSVVIGDITVYEQSSAANDQALAMLLAEWTSPRPFSERVGNLLWGADSNRANGDHFLEWGSSVLSDDDWDYLYGGAKEDLFLISGRKDLLIESGPEDEFHRR